MGGVAQAVHVLIGYLSSYVDAMGRFTYSCRNCECESMELDTKWDNRVSVPVTATVRVTSSPHCQLVVRNTSPHSNTTGPDSLQSKVKIVMIAVEPSTARK